MLCHLNEWTSERLKGDSNGLMYAFGHLMRSTLNRDIKLENILLDSKNQMKLIDFGLSAFYIPGKKLKVHCGASWKLIVWFGANQMHRPKL